MMPQTVLVTGATGYIGGRLVPKLLAEGVQVRVLIRGSRSRLNGRSWADKVDIVVGDVLQADTLYPALQGIDVAYYLIHGMADSTEFSQRDIQAAENFVQATARAGVDRIIYLGGLGDPGEELSEHLRSRQETGQALRSTHVPVTEFRAAVVVGSGSLSFELIRHLTERIPILICPRWVFTKVQPIAIEDILSYLTIALVTPESAGEIIEIGGPDVLTYGEMMTRYAQARDLRRYLLPVPVLTPTLSSYWVHLVTPMPARVARPLIKGLRNEVVVRDDKAGKLFPQINPISYDEALSTALSRIRDGRVETIWSDAQQSSRDDLPPVLLTQEQGMFIERRAKTVSAAPDLVFRAFTGLGGQRGWPPYHWLWAIRGLLGRLVGGVGLRRGRRHPDKLRVGDALDFWRVEAVQPNELLILRAEMKLPGQAWLRFRAKKRADGRTDLVQTAFFASRGLLGLLYWYALLPLHSLIFPRMVDYIAQQAEQLAQVQTGKTSQKTG